MCSGCHQTVREDSGFYGLRKNFVILFLHTVTANIVTVLSVPITPTE